MSKYLSWLLPIGLLLLITPLTPILDMQIERLFYQQDGIAPPRFIHHPFFEFIYDRGVMPAQVTVGIALIGLILSMLNSKWKSYRNPCLVLVLTMVIGSGLIVHAVLKDHWGRPRPKQVKEFGGIQSFRPYYCPNFSNQPEPSKSFPCGHCTMGFYFFSVAIVGKRMNYRLLYRWGMVIAFILGGLLGLTRMAQGGHFLSDVIVAGIIIWLTTLVCDRLIYTLDDEQL